MTHRAESIIVTLVSAVTNLTTTQTRVYRGRSLPLESSVTNALLVYMGPDRPLQQQESSSTLIDSELEVIIEAIAKSPTAQIDTTLNTIREEVTIALQANYTLGLSYVHEIKEGVTDEPARSSDGEQPSMALKMHWFVKYRRSRLNPGA